MVTENNLKLYAVGRILGSFGTKGFLKVEPLTHTIKRFKKLNEVYVGRDEENTTKHIVEHVNLLPKAVHVKLQTVSDKTTSDKLIGQYVFVEEHELARPAKGSYFIHEIIGCTVWSDGKQIGRVTEVLTTSQGLAQDVWIVESGGRQILIPAVREFVKDVQIKQRKIIIRTIEGLLAE